MARKIGFEKLLLRNNRLVGYFPANQDSPYFQSSLFTRVLEYVQAHPRKCQMKEKKDKLSLSFREVRSVRKALEILQPLRDKVLNVSIN